MKKSFLLDTAFVIAMLPANISASDIVSGEPSGLRL